MTDDFTLLAMVAGKAGGLCLCRRGGWEDLEVPGLGGCHWWEYFIESGLKGADIGWEDGRTWKCRVISGRWSPTVIAPIAKTIV